jgi:anti-anti-sigma regulatory factor
MESKIELEGCAASIELQGDLTVSNASQMRNILLQAFNGSDTLVISFGDISEIDLTCLQLLCSAHRMSIKLRKKLLFASDLPDVFRLAVADCGFKRHVGCVMDKQQSCIWQSVSAMKS